jgi:hypothetical protein
MSDLIVVPGVQPGEVAETVATSSGDAGKKNRSNAEFSFEEISELSSRIKAHDVRIGELNRKIKEADSAISKGFTWRQLAAGESEDTRRRSREKVLLTPTAVRDLKVKIGRWKFELAGTKSKRRFDVDVHRYETASATRQLRRKLWVLEYTHRAEEDPEGFLSFLVGKLNMQNAEVQSDLEAIRAKRVTDPKDAERDLMEVLDKTIFGAYDVLKRRPSMRKEFVKKFFGETVAT